MPRPTLTHPLLRQSDIGFSGSDGPSDPDATGGAMPTPVPDSIRRFGMWLFIASLLMLFGASLIGYLVVRLTNPAAPPPGFFAVPAGFYASTIALLAAGAAIEIAARAKTAATRRNALIATAALSTLFVALQGPPLVQLFDDHARALQATQAVGLYGLILTLIVVHAFHVVGGLIPLAIICYNQVAPRRPAPSTETVRAVALYWHFLDGVWISMLLTFLLTR